MDTYDFTIQYKPGHKHTNADVLSRKCAKSVNIVNVWKRKSCPVKQKQTLRSKLKLCGLEVPDKSATGRQRSKAAHPEERKGG